MKKILISIFSVAALCWSCSSEQIDSNVISDDEQEATDSEGGVYSTCPSIEWGDSLSATRSTLVLDGSTMKFAWAEGDQIGAYPILETPVANQMPLALISSAGSTSGEFGTNGERYRLLGGLDNKYAAYFPYNQVNEQNTYTAIPVDYTGQIQTATAKMSYYVAGNTTEYDKSEAEASAHLGAYDFMSNCATQTSDSHETTFSFARLSSIIRFYIEVPDNIIFDQLQIVNNSGTDGVFITKGTVNISAASPSITATTNSKTLSLSFGDSGLDFTDASTSSLYYSSTKGHHMLVAYMMLAPVDLTTDAAKDQTYLYLVGHTSTGIKKYYKTESALSNKKFEAGKIYQWTTKDDDIDASISLSTITVEQWTAETIDIDVSTD